MAATKANYVEDTPPSSISEDTEQTSLRKTQLQGGYECYFVKDPPTELQTDCSICLCLLKEPYHMDCKCGSNFCHTCIEPVKAGGKPCPLCNSTFTTAIPNRQLERILNEMNVYCSNRDSGCCWKGELVSLPEHLNVEPSSEKRLLGCRFSSLNCSHCRENVVRQDIADHEANKCLLRPFSCDYCHNYESTCEDVTTNHWPVCPFRPVPCPNECGIYPEHQNLEMHIAEHCPATVIECPFSYAGCNEKLFRREMPQHISTNLATHMSWQATYHQRQLKDFDVTLSLQKTHNVHELTKTRKELSIQTKQHSKQLKELNESVNFQTTACQQQLNDIQHHMQLQSDSHRQDIERLQQAVQNVMAENKALKAEVQKIRSEKQAIQGHAKQIQERSNRQLKALEEEKESMKHKLEQQTAMIASLLKNIKAITRSVQDLKKDQDSEKESQKSLQLEFDKQLRAFREFEKDSKEKATIMQQEICKLKPDVENLTQNQKLCMQKLKDHESSKKSLTAKSMSTPPNQHPTGAAATLQADHLKLERIQGDISEIKSEIRDSLKVHIGLIPVDVKMHNFRQYKSLGRDWFSSPFYTHPRGYKMCLNVDANGFGEGKDTHVSVFIYMMQGEFDSELKWPFCGAITVQILNSKRPDTNPHYTIVRFDQSSRANVASGRVYERIRADSGQGMLKFIAHADLIRHFLMHDTLCFRISKIDFL